MNKTQTVKMEKEWDMHHRLLGESPRLTGGSDYRRRSSRTRAPTWRGNPGKTQSRQAGRQADMLTWKNANRDCSSTRVSGSMWSSCTVDIND